MSTEVAIKKTVSQLAEQAEAFAITNPDQMSKAAEILSRLNKKNDEIEAEEDTVLGPMKEAMKAEKARWKPAKDILAEAIGIMRRKMSAYQTAAKAAAKVEEDKILARVGDGKGKLKLDTAVRKADEIEKPEDKVSAQSGSVQFRTVRKFEVEDLSKLPIEYHLANEVAIRAAMKSGTELPGVRYYDEEMPVNSR